MGRLVTGILLMFIAGSEAEAGRMAIGVKAGLNAANLTESQSEMVSYKSRMTFSGGIFFNYAFTERISVQPEMIFVIKGADSEITMDLDPGFYETMAAESFSYLDIPVLCKFSFPARADLVPALFIGPSFGFLISARERYPGGFEMDIKDSLKKSNISLVMGAGADYRIGKGCILLDIRYSLGIMDIIPGEEYEESTRDLTFMAGYGYYF